MTVALKKAKDSGRRTAPLGWAAITVEEELPNSKMLLRNTDTNVIRMVDDDVEWDEDTEEEVTEQELLICDDCLANLRKSVNQIVTVEPSSPKTNDEDEEDDDEDDDE